MPRKFAPVDPNLPTFGKLQTTLKRAIINWLVENFEAVAGPTGDRSQDGNMYFTFGELMDGVQEIMEDSVVSLSSFQTHLHNLKKDGRYISSLNENDVWGITNPLMGIPVRDRLGWISKDQRDRLLQVESSWESRPTHRGLAMHGR